MKKYRVLAFVLVALLLVTATVGAAQPALPGVLGRDLPGGGGHINWWHCTVANVDGYALPNNCWPSPSGAWSVSGTVGPTASCLGRTYRQITEGMWAGWWVLSSRVSCHWHD